MGAHIRDARRDKGSVGGCVRCVVRGLLAGLGEPVFGRLEAVLAQAMLSLPATKGFEFGSGFEGTMLRGSEHNDPFYMDQDRVRTKIGRASCRERGETTEGAVAWRR